MNPWRTKPEREDFRFGVLLGAAVGDALGVTHEFKPPHHISRRPLQVMGGGPFGFACGQCSDDTDMLLISLRAYRNVDAFDHDLAVRYMIDWMESSPPDVGGQTQLAIQAWKNGDGPPGNEDAQGNGGLMRAAAHAIGSSSAEAAAANAAQDTLLTHPSRVAADCSTVLARSLWTMLHERRVDLAPDSRFQPYPAPIEAAGSHCCHSVRLALWALVHAESYESGINQIIRTGGDTDTNAAIAGAVLGAKFGASGIPAHWLERVDKNMTEKLEREVTRLSWA